MNFSRLTYFTIVTGTLLWCAVLILAPLLLASESLAFLGRFLNQIFAPLCHQIDQRSFHLLGVPLPVCSRCASIYFAFLAGVLLYPLVCSLEHPGMPSRWLLLLAVLPMGLDVLTGVTGLHEVTNLTRTISGVLFGGVLPFIIIPTAIDAINELFASRSPSCSDHLEKGT